MKHVLIGGTGSLGAEITRILLERQKRVIVFSRDEAKQQEMKRRLPGAEYVLGDIRDKDAVARVISGSHAVYVLAAIKHIDVAEANPLEAVKTNVYGPINVAQAAMEAYVPHVIFSNTDKSVLPITTYGYTKAIAENYLLAQNNGAHRFFTATKFSVFNWGNIIASRGSVIPIFVKTLIEENRLYITDKRMSRFWLPIETAARFMVDNYQFAPEDRAMIPPIKAASVMRVAEMVADILKIKNYDVKVTGLRCVEKIHEVLKSSHEGCLRSDNCEQYMDDELRELLTATVTEEAKKYGLQLA